MIFDFMIFGLLLDNDDAVHKLSEFRSVMEQIIGAEAANLIMPRIKKELLDQRRSSSDCKSQQN
jgi:hypothetical protein